jgi:hypothetical protein
MLLDISSSSLNGITGTRVISWSIISRYSDPIVIEKAFVKICSSADLACVFDSTSSNDDVVNSSADPVVNSTVTNLQSTLSFSNPGVYTVQVYFIAGDNKQQYMTFANATALESSTTSLYPRTNAPVPTLAGPAPSPLSTDSNNTFEVVGIVISVLFALILIAVFFKVRQRYPDISSRSFRSILSNGNDDASEVIESNDLELQTISRNKFAVPEPLSRRASLVGNYRHSSQRGQRRTMDTFCSSQDGYDADTDHFIQCNTIYHQQYSAQHRHSHGNRQSFRGENSHSMGQHSLLFQERGKIKEKNRNASSPDSRDSISENDQYPLGILRNLEASSKKSPPGFIHSSVRDFEYAF